VIKDIAWVLGTLAIVDHPVLGLPALGCSPGECPFHDALAVGLPFEHVVHVKCIVLVQHGSPNAITEAVGAYLAVSLCHLECE
jgi:hypothetical protein